MAEARRGLAELQRVADYVWILSPSPAGLVNWAVPHHNLWVYQAPDGAIGFEQRRRGEQYGELWHPLLHAYWSAKDAAEVELTTGAGGRQQPELFRAK